MWKATFRALMVFSTITRASASAINDFFDAAFELESVFEDCAEGSIFDTIRDKSSECGPFRKITDMVLSTGDIEIAKDNLYLEFCTEGTVADCMQLDSQLTPSTPLAFINEFGCEVFSFATSSRRERQFRRGLQESANAQVSPKECLNNKVDQVVAIPKLYFAYINALQELGDCIMETDLLERSGAVRAAFQNIPLDQREPETSIVPVFYFDYGDASDYKAACTEGGGNFATLKFRATCTGPKLMEVEDRPRCYSSTCGENDDEALFQRYTIGPIEAINGAGWSCDGVLIEQVNTVPRIVEIQQATLTAPIASQSFDRAVSPVSPPVSSSAPITSAPVMVLGSPPVSSNAPVTPSPLMALGECVVETENLETHIELQIAFDNIPVNETDIGTPTVPISVLDYGDTSTYDLYCTHFGGRFVSLIFGASCSNDSTDETQIMEVTDRPRCYSWKCTDDDNETLFERYTLGPIEAEKGPAWDCTGTLVEAAHDLSLFASGVPVSSAPITASPMISSSSPTAVATNIIATPVSSPIRQSLDTKSKIIIVAISILILLCCIGCGFRFRHVKKSAEVQPYRVSEYIWMML